ncbi:MAG: flagellar hook-associated protein FlgL [bacterium]
MLSGRITNSYLTQSIVNNTMRNQEKYINLNMQYSTQKKINNLSDDPLSLTNLFDAKNNLSRIDVYNKSIDINIAEMDVCETTLDQVNKEMQRVFQLTTQAANEINSSGSTTAIANEIESILAHVVTLANTTYEGKYIFSGANINTPAYSVSGDDYTYKGTRDADGQNVKVQVNNNLIMSLGENGDNIFGEYYVNGAGVQVSTGPIGHIKELLKDLKPVPPATTANFAGIRAKIDVFTKDSDNVTYYRTQYGTNISSLEKAKEQLSQQKISTDTLRSRIEDADLVETASKMQYQEFALQASLQSSTKIIQNSLLNFLK